MSVRIIGLFCLFDKFSRISTYHSVRNNIFRNNRTGSYHGAFPNGDARANYGTASNLYAFLDYNRLATHDVMISEVMVCSHN